MKHAWFYDTAIGRIGIAENGSAITHVFFGDSVRPQEFKEEETPLLKQAAAQLAEYFAGARKEFDVPLEPDGTEFERSVWQALQTIPWGETRTYGQIAAQLGRPTASRAVGRANGRNPVAVIIPCHRVIGANGTLTGYAGGLDKKQQLLNLEQITIFA